MNLQDLINSISDENVKQLVLDNKWSEALDNANVNDKDIIAQAFLQSLKEGQWKNFADKLTNSEKVILKWIKELGVREANNPYLQFIPKYFSKQNAQLSENNAVSLNNLYSEDAIDFGDIAGTGAEGTNHLIFSPQLYNFNMDDLDFIVKAYQSLSESYFVKKLNLNAIASQLDSNEAQNLSTLSSELSSGNNETQVVKAIRDLLIFDRNNKKIRSRYELEKLLSSGENTAKQGTANTNISKDFNKLSAEDKKSTLKQMFPTLSDAQLNTLYSMTNLN